MRWTITEIEKKNMLNIKVCIREFFFLKVGRNVMTWWPDRHLFDWFPFSNNRVTQKTDITSDDFKKKTAKSCTVIKWLAFHS